MPRAEIHTFRPGYGIPAKTNAGFNCNFPYIYGKICFYQLLFLPISGIIYVNHFLG